jgi:hypothetical protein
MRLPATRMVCLPRRDPSITSTMVTARMATAGARVRASRMATVGARGVHSMSSRQARPDRTFITLLPERPGRREVVERPVAAWRRTVVMIASL